MVSGISGKTRVCGIFGYPVEHSFSPAMQNQAFRATGLDYVYVPFPVKPGGLPAAVSAIKDLGLAGVNVTIPHKEPVLPLLDKLTREAELTGAVNTIVNQSGHLLGDNTDGRGFLRSLQEEAGFDPAGKTVLLLGAGGAARAVAVQLGLAGAATIFITNRSKGRAEEVASFVTEMTGAGTIVLDWPVTGGTLPGEALQAAQLVVQATPLGMYPKTTEAVPLSYELFRPGQVVCDIVYNPVKTRFLKEAGQSGAKVVDGLGMLLYQGALAFELWTGVAAPVQVMRKALEEVLSC